MPNFLIAPTLYPPKPEIEFLRNTIPNKINEIE